MSPNKTVEALKMFVQELEETSQPPQIQELDVRDAFHALKALECDYHLDVSLKVTNGKPELDFQVYLFGIGTKAEFFMSRSLAGAVHTALQWKRERDTLPAEKPVEAMQAALQSLVEQPF